MIRAEAVAALKAWRLLYIGACVNARTQQTPRPEGQIEHG
jgi:hypothetical protein